MEAHVNLWICLLVFISALILQVFCNGLTSNSSFYTRNQFIPASNANSNAWPRLGNNQNAYPTINPHWVNFGQSTTTTPWPALGQRRTQYNDRVNSQTITQSSSGTRFSNNANIEFPFQQTNQGGNSEDEELRQFAENLLEKDVNNAARYLTVNYQGKTTSRSKNDEAPLPLLQINPDVYNIPTIAKLLPLHNNYIVETNMNEYVSPQEKEEENTLLDLILSTQVMQFTRNFLIEKGKIGRDPKDFKNLLKEIWFNMYSRGGGRVGSSGFEHIFLGEIKNGMISGLHNWLYFQDEEAHNRANYLGYMKKIEFNNKGAILKFHFKFHNVDKPVGSMFIGTSPEMEMALYSTCFILRPDQVCPLRLGGNNFIIRTYTYRYRGKNMIGSAFPEI